MRMAEHVHYTARREWGRVTATHLCVSSQAGLALSAENMSQFSDFPTQRNMYLH